jgi:hypothetical protein
MPPDQPEDLAVGHLACHPRHQHIELDPVEEPVQVNVHDPLQAVLDAPPRDPDRLVGGPAGTERSWLLEPETLPRCLLLGIPGVNCRAYVTFAASRRAC